MPAFILVIVFGLQILQCVSLHRVICVGFMFLIQSIGLSTILLGSYQIQSFHCDTVESYVYIRRDLTNSHVRLNQWMSVLLYLRSVIRGFLWLQKKVFKKKRESQILLKQELKNVFGNEEESNNGNYITIRKSNTEICS